MTTSFIQFEELRLPIIVTKRKTSRRLILRYSPLRQCVSLTLPKSVSLKYGLNFVEQKREWIRLQLQKHSGNKGFVDGQIIPVLGENLTLKYVGGRGIISEASGALQVHGANEFMARRVRSWLQKKCKIEIMRMADIYAARLGVKLGKISLRDTSSRWGSCSHDGNLSFSWRLIFAPIEVLHYVVAHEVAHIREHNHSPAFWAYVAQICPNWKHSRDWLKKHGTSLYNYGNE